VTCHSLNMRVIRVIRVMHVMRDELSACASVQVVNSRPSPSLGPMADHSLSMAALRVAVNAPRDGEMRALSEALAVSRARHLDVLNRFAMSEEYAELAEDRHSVELARSVGHNEELRAALAGTRRELTTLRDEIQWYSLVDLPRERLLREAGARTARWVQRCVAGNVPMSDDLRDDIVRILEDDEAEGDAEPMLQDDAELGEDRHGGGMLTSEIEHLRAALAEAREENGRVQREANVDRRQVGEIQRLLEWRGQIDFAREMRVLRAGARIARWVVQRCLAENVPTPAELRGDIALVHDDEINGDPDAVP
jgi:hypothetical protein